MAVDRAHQFDTARRVVAVGRRLGVPELGWWMALSAALVETECQNLSYGDKDSLGVFQQRGVWGTAAQRQNVEWATAAFYVGTRNSNGWYPGLTSFTGWEKRSFRDAITAVQHPVATSEIRYDQRKGDARALLDRVLAAEKPPPGEDYLMPITEAQWKAHDDKTDAILKQIGYDATLATGRSSADTNRTLWDILIDQRTEAAVAALRQQVGALEAQVGALREQVAGIPDAVLAVLQGGTSG